MTTAAKRYTRWFLFWMMIYSALILGAGLSDWTDGLSPSLGLALAVSPVAPALMALREFVIFLRGMDEVQARIHCEALLISMGVVGFTTFTWGFAENAVNLPEVSMIFILPFMVAVWGLALPVVMRRYR